MKKKVYFRIIELDNSQMLLQKSYDEEEEKPTLIVSFHVEGCYVTQTHGYNEESKRDKMFNTYTDVQAQSMFDSTLKLLKEG